MFNEVISVKNRRPGVRKVNSRKKIEPKGTLFQRYWLPVKMVSFSLAIAVLLGVSVYSLGAVLKGFIYRPIGTVEVVGKFSFLAKDELVNLISQEIKRSFVRESLLMLQQNLQNNPWIDRVTVRRQWPDKLLVSIVEQQPIARWGNESFVNHRGELIRLTQDALLQNLPLLSGPDFESVSVMKQYQLLSQLLIKQELKLLELNKSDLGVWTLLLNNGWEIKTGRSESVRKIQTLMGLLQSNKIDKLSTIRVIDMRYDNGMAVQHHHKQSS